MTLKVTQPADAPIGKKVRGTFETCWNDAEFEPFDEAKLRDALEEQRQPALRQIRGQREWDRS